MTTPIAKFNDIYHYQNFLNYLFRTDKNQKWTNADIIRDFCFFVVDGKPSFFNFPEDLEERKLLRRNGWRTLTPALSHKLLNMGNDIIYLESNRNLLNVEPEMRVDLAFHALEETNNFADNSVHVVHLDQMEEGFHIHSVFTKWHNREKQRKDRIRQ